MKPFTAPRAPHQAPGAFRPRAAAAAFAITLLAAGGSPVLAKPDQPPLASTRSPGTAPSEHLPGVDLTPQIIFQLLASEIAVQRGQSGTATATYLALAQKTRDPRLAKRATELALSERALDRALQAAQLWQTLAPDSIPAAQTLETLWLTAGRFEQAKPLIEQRLARARAEGTVEAAYEQLSRTLMRSPDKSAALALLEGVAASDPKVVQARLALAGLASAAGQTERAALEAGQALALRPADESVVVTAARLVQNSSAGAEGAIRLLQAYLGQYPKALEARFQYARTLAAAGRSDEARREMELALQVDPESPPVLFSLAQLAYQSNQPTQATDYLMRYIGLPDTVDRDNNPAYLFLSQIAEEQKQPQQAIDWLAKVERGEQALAALQRRALLTARDGRLEEARALLRNAQPGSNRERVQLIALDAQLLREANRAAEAFEVLDKALERLPNNLELLYDHAMAAERIDRLPVMEASLRKLIALKPDHAHAHNALGYSLADRGLRLTEAQALIERAMQLLPDDAHILDSMGWVLFRRGENERAAEFLRRAYALRPEAEIAAHLGEVLWKLGHHEEARRLWVEARGREPDNQTLKETLARLNVAI